MQILKSLKQDSETIGKDPNGSQSTATSDSEHVGKDPNSTQRHGSAGDEEILQRNLDQEFFERDFKEYLLDARDTDSTFDDLKRGQKGHKGVNHAGKVKSGLQVGGIAGDLNKAKNRKKGKTVRKKANHL